MSNSLWLIMKIHVLARRYSRAEGKTSRIGYLKLRRYAKNKQGHKNPANLERLVPVLNYCHYNH